MSVVAVAVLLVACSDGTMSDARPLVRDSAGVRIVETDPSVWPPPEVWTVSDSPVVTIGAGLHATLAMLRTSMYELQPLEQRGWAIVMGDASPPPVATHGMRFYRNDGWRVAVDVYEADRIGTRTDPGERSGPSARLARSYRVHAPREPYDEANREAYTQAIVDLYEREGSEADRAEYRERIESLASPDSVPMVQDLRVDPSGHVWLEMWTPIGPRGREYARTRGYALDRGPSRWLVLDPDGVLVGSVQVPAELEVLEIGEDYLLGVVTDALGVEYIRVHRLDRGSAGGSSP